MASLVIPCIRKVKKGSDDTTVNFSFGAGEDGGGSGYILIKPGGSPIDILITPFPPFVLPVPDFEVIFNDLFGKSRIQRQKDEIQRYLTQAFRFVFNNYGFPLADDHALQFKSSGVRREFLKRPDLAILADAMWTDADAIITGAFGYDKSGPGIHERFVNQFLANAAYNSWPLQATLDLWHALVRASTCIPKTTEPPPPPPPPGPGPGPGPGPQPQRDCPPGMDMATCLELCGKIRQLTAGQQPIPPEISQYLSYFQDCILPPDGSWHYNVPVIQSDWIRVFSNLFYRFPDDAVIIDIPQWAWPFRWPDGTYVREVQAPGTGGPYPAGTLIVTPPDQPTYGVDTTGQTICVPPSPQGLPDPPDVDDPPDPPLPPDPTPRLDDLQQQIWAIQADVKQFKEIVFAQFDSLKKALWDSMIRSNFQAAEVYAKDQPDWQGPPPPADQPPLPPGWQTLPTPGNPQVLELPPLQSFPQVLPAPGFDWTSIAERISRTEDENSKQWDSIQEIFTRFPMLIDEAISRYDTNVEKPDIQKIRDECCQPQVEPPSPQPTDPCEEGREKWGIEAECWHEANGQNPYPIDEDIAARKTPAESTLDFDQAVSKQPSGAFLERRLAADNAFLAAVKGQWSRPTNSYAPKLRTWVYQNPVPPIGL